MSSSLIQILVLAGIALFLILKLRSVLGTRDGYERPAAPRPLPGTPAPATPETPDDLDDLAPGHPEATTALRAMKLAEPAFSLSEFLHGARGAYEMILMAYERGDIAAIRPYLSPEVASTFTQALNARSQQGLTVEASFVGLREVALDDATFDSVTGEAELTVRFTGELTSVTRNAAGEVVDGSASEIRRQRDLWTFARRMGSNDPNWQLVATGD